MNSLAVDGTTKEYSDGGYSMHTQLAGVQKRASKVRCASCMGFGTVRSLT
jgi:hypothetical protein